MKRINFYLILFIPRSLLTVLLCSDSESGVIVLLRWAALRAFRVVAACTNLGTNLELSRSVNKKNS